MTTLDLNEARKSTDPCMIPVLCNVIDRLTAQLHGMQSQRDEAKLDAEIAKSERNKEHVHTLAAKKLVFEAQHIMRRWGFLCPNERESWDLRVEEFLRRRAHRDQASNARGQTAREAGSSAPTC
jgi:hypothetical protein